MLFLHSVVNIYQRINVTSGVPFNLQYRMSVCIDIIANRLQLVAQVTESGLCMLRDETTFYLRHVHATRTCVLVVCRRWLYVSNCSCSKRAYNCAFRENLNNLLFAWPHTATNLHVMRCVAYIQCAFTE